MSERVACPSCGREYPVPEVLWQSGRVSVRCPNCGKRFVLRFEAEGAAPELKLKGPRPPGTRDENARDGEKRDVPHRDGEARDPALRERRARRLARALVSDLARGREAERKKALEDGSLILIFSESIRKAWDEFRNRIEEDDAEASRHFREALNDVLAEGKSLF